MTRRHDRPAPLITAASLVAVEGVLLLAYAVAEAASLSVDRLMLGLTTTAFFALYGGGLLVCAWQLTRGNSWARGPAVMAQLIQLGLAFSLWGGTTTWAAVLLGVTALVVLAGILHPASVDALGDGAR